MRGRCTIPDTKPCFFAHNDLSAALGSGVIYDSSLDAPKEYFRGLKAHIEANVDVDEINRTIQMDGYSLEASRSMLTGHGVSQSVCFSIHLTTSAHFR
jgi:hypothetical protein